MFVGTMVIQKVERSVVTSLDVAETFEKEHSKVLRDIRELECSEDFRLSNFGQSSYINLQGKKMPMYHAEEAIIISVREIAKEVFS